MRFGGHELFLLFLADVMEIFLLERGEPAQPAGRRHVAGGEVAEHVVDLLMLGDRVAREVGGFGIAQHARPQRLLLGRGVGLELLHQFLEQRLAIGRLAFGFLDHRQQGAVAVVILDEAAENIGVTAEFRFGRAADPRRDAGRDRLCLRDSLDLRLCRGFALRRIAIEDAGWIAKDVAYIRFAGFPDDPDTAAVCNRFMREHATAKAVIIDARYNGGGGVVQMNAILPYLYSKPTVLVQMEMVDSIAKARGNPFAEDAFLRPASGAAPGIVRTEHYVVPRTDETRLFGAKAFYLVSGRTASAAEHLALAFKHTGRATLIGETTAGANHFGGFEPIGGGLAVFLPVGRTIDPATGKDWEGTGIVPDIAVAPTLALQEALRQAGAID